MLGAAALLAGSAILVSLQLRSDRSTELTRTGISALYCAEAGLAASRAVVAANHAMWGAYLGTGIEPSWLASGVEHDIDGDGLADFIATIEDNWDEIGADVPGVDSDGKVFVVSRCLKYPDAPREVRELIDHTSKRSLWLRTE